MSSLRFKSWMLIPLMALAFAGGFLIRGGGSNSSPSGHEDHAEAEKPQRWTCSMHPQIILPSNDQMCPICNMELIPLMEDNSSGLGSNQLALSEEAAALADVGVSVVQRRFVARRVPLVGKVAADETRLREITARFGGRLERLYLAATGERVTKGMKLAEIYSPEMYGAQAELQTAVDTFAGSATYDGLKVHLTHLQNATTTLQDRTTTLASALRGTQVRGRWGELALRNIAELAGMTEHCDFTEQTTTDEGKRPDMVVRLPEGRFIAVDSKVPLAGYLKAVEAADEEGRQAGLKEHVQAVRNHIKTLAARNYAESLEGDVDLVVLFLPGDPFLAAAFGEDPDLQVEAIGLGVLLATPTTLVALLRTVAIYHQHLTLAENAREIGEVAATLYDRAAKFGDDLARAGRGLKTAVDAYNAAVGSFERRILPMGQKLEALKVTEQTKRRINAPQVLTEGPRTVSADTGEETPGESDD